MQAQDEYSRPMKTECGWIGSKSERALTCTRNGTVPYKKLDFFEHMP